MAPKSKIALSSAMGPKFLERGVRVKLEDISVDPNYSGWRGLDGARQQELREEVESGRYGMNILGLPQLLKDDSNTALLDPAGRMLVGDGLQVTSILQILKKEWIDDGKPSIDSRVEEIFTLGLVVDFVAFPRDSGPEIREIWYSAIHDEESNRYKPTSLSQKIAVIQRAVDRVDGGDLEKAKKTLLNVLGDGAKSRVARWARAWKNLSKEVAAALPEFATVPHGYIFDNAYLLGEGARARQKLKPRFAIRSLELAKQACLLMQAKCWQHVHLNLPGPIDLHSEH